MRSAGFIGDVMLPACDTLLHTYLGVTHLAKASGLGRITLTLVNIGTLGFDDGMGVMDLNKAWLCGIGVLPVKPHIVAFMTETFSL